MSFRRRLRVSMACVAALIASISAIPTNTTNSATLKQNCRSLCAF